MTARSLDRLRAPCYKVPMPLDPPRVRPGRIRPAALVAATIAVALSCSSDPDGPVGSDSDVLGSRPGQVFEDTIGVYADTVYEYHTLIARDSSLSLGRGSGYERAIIVDFNYTDASQYATRTVVRAELRLAARDLTGSVPARFHRLRTRYAEGDSVALLDTLAVMPDPGSGSVERSLQTFPDTYGLAPEVVQEWVRDSATRQAIAIVYTDPVDRVVTFKGRESARQKPALFVDFDAGGGAIDEKTFFARSDATFIRPTGTTDNLVVSDGFVRRVYFRARLDELAEQSAVHTARVRFHIVPGTLIGTNTTLVVYAPSSANPASAAFRSGQLITSTPVFDGDTTVEFTVSNALFLTLQGSLDDNGFVIQLESENTELRQLELYGSDAPDSLRPRVYITSSTPADFDP